MAITYGMSVKEFWEDDPNLFWAYRFSYYNKMTDKQEIFNYNAWLQGAYIYEAVQGLLTNCRVFWLWFVFSCLSDHIYEELNRKAKRFEI